MRDGNNGLMGAGSLQEVVMFSGKSSTNNKTHKMADQQLIVISKARGNIQSNRWTLRAH